MIFKHEWQSDLYIKFVYKYALIFNIMGQTVQKDLRKYENLKKKMTKDSQSTKQNYQTTRFKIEENHLNHVSNCEGR